MKATLLSACTMVGCAAMLAADSSQDHDLLARLKSLEGMIKITGDRVRIPPLIDEGCVAFQYPHGDANHNRLIGRPVAAIHVYVTEAGVPMFRQRDGVFPVNTIVLKQKFSSLQASMPELYTGMIKREKGYNPRMGDWEFFTAKGDATAIISRGRIDSCMDCHQQFAKTDFVTKRYVSSWPQPKAASGVTDPNAIKQSPGE
jgi:hypothetical protein